MLVWFLVPKIAAEEESDWKSHNIMFLFPTWQPQLHWCSSHHWIQAPLELHKLGLDRELKQLKFFAFNVHLPLTTCGCWNTCQLVVGNLRTQLERKSKNISKNKIEPICALIEHNSMCHKIWGCLTSKVLCAV
jgi:hypothetical protein